MQSRLRVLDRLVTDDSEQPRPHDVVTFLSSIYQAKKFRITKQTESDFDLEFDVPTFDVYLLDQFTKRRFDRRLHQMNFMVLALPVELSLLTKVDVAATLVDNCMCLRFNLADQFINIKFELMTSSVQNMKRLIDEIHNSHLESAFSLVCSHAFDERNTEVLKQQIASNRVYRVASCRNDMESVNVLKSFDKDLCLMPGVTCC